MSCRPVATEIARWITRDVELVEHIVDEILMEEATWLALRNRQSVHGGTVWEDGAHGASNTKSGKALRSLKKSELPESLL